MTYRIKVSGAVRIVVFVHFQVDHTTLLLSSIVSSYMVLDILIVGRYTIKSNIM
jgi:hypothetical protein